MPLVALEQRTRLLRISSNLFSRYCVCGNQSSLQSSIIPRYLIFETTFIPHATIVGCRLYSPLFRVNIGISADFSLEIYNLWSLHHSSIVWSVLCSVVRMAEGEGPCIINIMSSAKTTILTFGAFERSAIRSLMIVFHKVGSETDPCGQPLLTRLEQLNFLL